MDPTVCLVSASRQNVFFSELLEALTDALSDCGVAVEHSVDCFPPPRDELVYLFVPHELLPLLMADAHPSEAQLRRSIAICTEQPGTPWFDEDARVASLAAVAIDINRLGVAALRKLGVKARLLQLGYVPAWDHWGGEQSSERPIELTFQGGATPRRLEAVARCARQIPGRRTELHLFESALPHQADSEHFLSGARKWDMLSCSKVMLNIHRSELGYLEWQRAIGAMVNGCVFLSEHSLGFEPFVPGEHFVSVSFDSLDVAAGALLEDDERLTRLRASAYSFLREQTPLATSIEVLAEAVVDVAKLPVPATAGRPRPTPPRPKTPARPPTEYERILACRSDLDVLRMGMKQLVVDQRALRGAVHRLQVEARGGHIEDRSVERRGRRPAGTPRVSVVLTVYNYGSLVGAAIRSVAMSEFDSYELIVINDASTDGSAAAIDAALEAAPWVSATVVTSLHNRGLARARNLGAQLAAAELLFILDADNAIYPHALGELVRTMDEAGDAAFAYGLIEQFGVNGPSGLISYLGWDPVRLRYGNFVDAMAMIRRSALLDAGGYSTDPRLYGWEDFALWCAIAERGGHGVRVPEVLARYRVALHSMISLTNLDASSAWSLLIDQFPSLSAD